jgi:CIC family chloride channel protein
VKVLFFIEDLYRKLPISVFWHPAIGAVIFVTVGLWQPRALGVGYDAIGDVLAGRLALATVAALCAAKLIAWWFALASGTSGGTLAPMLLVSAGFGTVVGDALNHVLPGADVALGAFAVVAMAATVGAATRATFASMVFVFELTRDYEVVLPLMLATVIADLVATALNEDSIMTEKLTRRGLRIGRRYAADPFVSTPSSVVMSTHEGEVGHLASVAPGDPVLSALHVMLEEGVDRVPVEEDGVIVGVITRDDLLKVHQHQLDLERRQVGAFGRLRMR